MKCAVAASQLFLLSYWLYYYHFQWRTQLMWLSYQQWIGLLTWYVPSSMEQRYHAAHLKSLLKEWRKEKKIVERNERGPILMKLGEYYSRNIMLSVHMRVEIMQHSGQDEVRVVRSRSPCYATDHVRRKEENEWLGYQVIAMPLPL